MNINKFTQKSMQVVQDCEKIALEYGNQEIDQEHLLYSLITVEDSLIQKLLKKIDITTEVFQAQVEGLIKKRPKVSGGQNYISNDLNKVLIYAEDEAKMMKDEYVSVEHLFLSMLKYPN
ncbi:Clp protease N-terminal domain-containing protein, partial [Clostridium sp.]|uniref:Clp protease N-terminal domain-containing protein n=1 Tax=Clostridium sp. TaxID=1506 RepID=UPI002588582A